MSRRFVDPRLAVGLAIALLVLAAPGPSLLPVASTPGAPDSLVAPLVASAAGAAVLTCLLVLAVAQRERA